MSIRHILLAAIAASIPLVAGDLDGPVLRSVTIRGAAPDVTLATQVGRPYDAATVARDVRALWNLGRFSDIRAELDPAGNLVFRAESKQVGRLHEVRVEPNTFGLQIKTAAASAIDDLGAHQMALEAQRQLQARGYAHPHVDYRFERAPHGEVDLKLLVNPGTAVRVKRLVFEGSPGLGDAELRNALRALRAHRIFFWRLLPDCTEERVDYDVARLRSLYLSKGFYDVRVSAGTATIEGKDATVAIWIESGRQYGGAPDARAVCKTYFGERREAERDGVLDFSARLHVELTGGGSAEVKASGERGPAYRVGRIEFSGNHRTPDATLRRNFVLQEAEPLNGYLLQKSIARLNRSGLVEPIDMKHVIIATNPQTGIANIGIRLEERKRGSWNFSGPVGPAGLAGPLEASLGARLPAWGRGIFELSTYAVSISAIGLYRPVLSTLGPPKNFFIPVIALRRPFLPAESWTSGFAIAPQLGWQAAAFGYATTQFQERLLQKLAGDRGLTPDLPVTVEIPHGQATLFCEAPKLSHMWLRATASILVRLPSAFLSY